MKISIVVPTYREEANILKHYQECIKAIDKVRENYPEFDTYEYFVIDNCSDDKTVEKVLSMKERDKNIKLFVNDKNYGAVLSPFFGILNCTGDVVFLIAADLQEPPAMLLKFIEGIREGYDASIGIKKESKENFFMWKIRGFYYFTLKAFGLIQITSRYSGFGLYKSSLIDEFRDNNLEEPTMRVLLPLKTKNIYYCSYDHLERKHGTSSYDFYSYVKEALKTIVRNSTRIPSIAAKLSITLTFLSIILIPVTITLKLLFWQSLGPGIASIIILLLLINSGLLLLISLLLDRQGQILSRLKPIRKEVKQKKIYK